MAGRASRPVAAQKEVASAADIAGWEQRQHVPGHRPARTLFNQPRANDDEVVSLAGLHSITVGAELDPAGRVFALVDLHAFRVGRVEHDIERLPALPGPGRGALPPGIVGEKDRRGVEQPETQSRTPCPLGIAAGCLDKGLSLELIRNVSDTVLTVGVGVDTLIECREEVAVRAGRIELRQRRHGWRERWTGRNRCAQRTTALLVARLAAEALAGKLRRQGITVTG